MFVLHLKNGLCNRIRTILAYWIIWKRTKKPILVVWIPDKECPCHYLDYFLPIPGVRFLNVVSDKNIHVLKYRKDLDYHFGSTLISSVAKRYHMKITRKDVLTAYQQVKVKKEVIQKVEVVTKNADLANCIGIHLRRTDFGELLKKRNWVTKTDEQAEKFIEEEIKKQPDRKFFLATDNQKTQEWLQDRFPQRILIYEAIQEKDELRQTPMEQAVIELFLLSRCKEVSICPHSSFSITARHLNRVYKLSKGLPIPGYSGRSLLSLPEMSD